MQLKNNFPPSIHTPSKMDDLSGLYLDTIINNLPHYLFWKDINSKFLGCNKVFLESAGFFSSKEIIGKTDYDMPWAAMADSYVADDQAIMTSGIPKLNYEELQPQTDGSEKVMLVSKVPLKTENKMIIGILCIYTDITERKQIEKELKAAKEKAEMANKAKTEFIRNMEHDIRTPFNGIMGLASILLQQETDQEKKETISDILNCTTELLDYSNGILDFSRIESGSLVILEQKFDLSRLIDSLMGMELPAAKLKNINIIFEIQDNVPNFLIGDRYRLQRILINLLSNSIKFTQEGFVKLTFKVAKVIDQRNIIIQAIVQDSGIGISSELQNLIYEKFSRMSESSMSQYKGKGLGLSIVKRFIHDMEGEIDMESNSGEGTTFICTLPFKLPLL